MIAGLARALRQPVDHIEEWSVDKFDAYFDAAVEIMKGEAG